MADLFDAAWNHLLSGDHDKLMPVSIGIEVSLLGEGSLINVVNVLNIGNKVLVEETSNNLLSMLPTGGGHLHPDDAWRTGSPHMLVLIREGICSSSKGVGLLRSKQIGVSLRLEGGGSQGMLSSNTGVLGVISDFL